MDLVRRVGSLLDAAGLDLRGALSTSAYDLLVPPAWRCDALLPGARTALVIGSGGRALWRAARESGAAGSDPLDLHTARALAACVTELKQASHAAVALFAPERRGGAYADFVALGYAAGLGAPSRLGLLVHPVYGPWLSLRALLLMDLAWPESAPLRGFDPCTGCPAPCADACHGRAVGSPGFDVPRCADTRRRDPRCALRCDARHACVLGRDRAYLAEAEAYHMRSVSPQAMVESQRDRT
ncbi:MAG TPA: hypothetical protein VMS55_05140 [Myxococcota bacterium]|nr:hypothetical protein [Myxococcota bacterium]